MGTLGSALLSSATKGVVDTLIKTLESELQALRDDERNIKSAITTKEQAIAEVRRVFEQPARSSDNLYFLSSRSLGGPGHFIERKADGSLTCSCKGFSFRGQCWATTYLKPVIDRGDGSWRYGNFDLNRSVTEAQRIRDFDERVKYRDRNTYDGRIGPRAVIDAR